MFDLGWSELFIIGLVTLLVVGPKELPRVLRTISQLMAKARGLAREFQSSVDEMVRESELDDLKKEIKALKGDADISGQMRSIMRDAEEDLEQSTGSKSNATTPDDPVSAANRAATQWPVTTDNADKPLVGDDTQKRAEKADGLKPATAQAAHQP